MMMANTKSSNPFDESQEWAWVELHSQQEDDSLSMASGRTRTSSEASSSEDDESSLTSTTPSSSSECNLKELDASIDMREKNSEQSLSEIKASTRFLFLMPLLAIIIYGALSTPRLPFDGEESIYIPGVGFSGFWFSLGRLKSIDNPATKNYVCFSAGCLGAVTILNNFTVDEMACMASSAQSAWKNGEISRYDVVSEFVDGIVFRAFPRNPYCLLQSSSYKTTNEIISSLEVPINNRELFSRLHILTSQRRRGYWGMKAVIRSPTSLEELRKMLIQTTWM